MQIEEIIAYVDQELDRLNRVKTLLAEGGTGSAVQLIKNETPASGNGKPRKKRTMSAEARERIAAAQRKRWAAQKKAAK